ncbi:DUF5455 family protein [Candidatus Pacearchaeota archaeon]|nr:DUF5455 family protein [Candidatus Pacearchaeota archaeon]
MFQILPIITAAGTALRVSALVGFFAGLIGQMMALFATWFTKRMAIQATVVVSVVALSTAVFVAIKLVIASIVLTTPSYVQQGLNMVLPSNFSFCVSALLGAKIVRWVWAWKVHFIEMYAGVN